LFLLLPCLFLNVVEAIHEPSVQANDADYSHASFAPLWGYFDNNRLAKVQLFPYSASPGDTFFLLEALIFMFYIMWSLFLLPLRMNN